MADKNLSGRRITMTDKTAHFELANPRELAALRALGQKIHTALSDHVPTWPSPVYEVGARDGYPDDGGCVAWRIDGRISRELFVEVPGRLCPGFLRVGLYFRDSTQVLSRGTALTAANLIGAVLEHSSALARLGVQPILPTRTNPYADRPTGWSRNELSRWLRVPGDKDLVRRFTLPEGYSRAALVRRVIQELVPIWQAWNGPSPTVSSRKVDEGGRREVVRELSIRNPRLTRDARRYYGVNCMVCGFNFETVYGEYGKGFIEVHHLRSLGAGGRRVSTIQDVRCVCANCHRMLHRGREILAVEVLRRKIVRTRKAKSAQV
jgi:hypothetical protein